MEKTTRRVTSVVSFVLALLTVLASCNVSLLTGAALTTQVTDLTELIVDSESVNLNSDSNSSYEEDEWITYEAPLYNSDGPVLLSDDVAGDINGDGRSTVVDSVALLQYLAGGDVACVYNAMDVNGDKQINKQDVGALIKYIVGFTKTVNVQPACAHTFADPIAVAVTCTEDGTREHWECSTCHVKFSDAQGTVAVTDRYLTVKASGHKEAVIPAVAATCVEKGATAGVKCKTCSAVLTAPKDVDPTGNHTYTDPIPEIKATVTTTGMTAGTRCSVCGNIGVNPVLVPALGTAELIYELTGDYYTVKGLAESCTADVIIIPAFYNGKPVKAIAPGAFANRTHITEVVILSYESSATIKPKGPEVELTGGVTEIGEGAFSGCTGLTDVDMGNCVENISNAAFSGCSSLENVNISENVSNIGEGSFTGCANLETVTLPGAVENIGNNAFAGCESLTSLDYQGTQEEWADLSKNNIWEENKEVKVSCYSEGLLMDLSADGTYYIVAGIGECKDTELKLPAEYKGLPVTQIKESAFQNNTTITSVSIPKSITFIGKEAFDGSTVLTKVSITDLAAWCSIDFETINANPLYFAKNLYLNDKLVTDLVIGNEIESIANFAFSKCNIQSVTIGNGVKSIGARAFEQCGSLTEIVIPDNVTTLGARVFAGCDNLTTAHVGNGIKLLSAFTFSNCSKLTTVTLGSSINKFGAGVFFGCTALTSVNIPAGVTSFYGECFYNCSSLASIKLPEGLQNIGDHTFYGCSALTEIVIPDSVTEIGSNAFNSCTSLTKVTIGSGVETIGGMAFNGDTALTSVYIKDLAAWCEISFTNISSNPLSANISDEIGELYVNGVLLTDLRIPEGVEKIGGYAFRGITTLKTVVIPEGVSEIGTYAFANCTALQHVELPASLQILGEYVFLSDKSVQSIIYYGSVAEWNKVQKTNWNERCPIATPSIYSIGLELVEKDGSYTVTGIGSCADVKLTIPEYYNGKPVTAIAANAFNGVSNITSVIIPASVTSIGTGAFGGCTNLSKLTVAEGNQAYISVGNCIIETATKTLVAGCKKSVIPNDGSVISIANSAFLGCTGLKTVTIPQNVFVIGENAFKGCKNLKTVNLSNSVEVIADAAFSGCDSLISISIPSSVKVIGTDVFYACKSIKTVIYCGTAAEWANISMGEGWNISVLIASAGLEYVLNAKGTAYSVAGIGTCTDTDLVIPSVYNGLPVTTIAKEAFSGNQSIRSLFIPGSISIIETNAFNSCNNISAVYIDDIAAWCQRSYNNYASNPLYYGANLYVNDKLLTDLVVPAGVTMIGSFAFDGYAPLKSVTFPEGVKNINAFAFRDCNGITEVVFPESLTAINGNAFESCSLTKVHLPANVTTVYSSAFRYNPLTSITVDKNNTTLRAFGTTLIEIATKTLLICNDGIIPSDGSVTTIDKSVFLSNRNLTEIVIPASVTSIGNSAFSGCTKLTCFIYDGTADQWEAVVKGENWNRNCSFTVQFTVEADGHIHNVTKFEPVAPTCTKIGFTKKIACSACGKIFAEPTIIPATGHTEGEWVIDKVPTKTEEGIKHTNCTVCGEVFTAFIQPIASEGLVYTLNKSGTAYSLTGMGTCTDTDVVIAGEYNGLPVTMVARNVFNEYASLTSLYVPGSIVDFEWSNYGSCDNFTKVMISDLAAWCETSFNGNPLFTAKNLYLNGKLITDLVIPEGVESIGFAAFSGANINSAVLPSTLKNISSEVFYCCENLKSINIPASLELIEGFAFSNSNLENIIIDPANKTFVIVNNCLIDVAQKMLVYGFGNCSIPSDGNVTKIGRGALAYNQTITEIVIPDGVTSLGYSAFENCTNLTTVVIPNSVTDVGNYVFNHCEKLVNVNLPEGITMISRGMFQSCESLVSVVIPAGVTSIDAWAFNLCSSLTNVIIPGSVTNIGERAFSSCDKVTAFIFDGTQAQWEAVTKGNNWSLNSKFTVQFMVAEDGHRHDQTKVDAVAPTCTKSGLTEGVKCSACGYVLVEQSLLPATGHAAGEWTVTKEPTKTEEGMKKTSCTACGLEFTSYIQPIASEGLVYTLNNNGKSYSLTSLGTCTDTDVVIAGEYEGLPVTSIAAGVFGKNDRVINKDESGNVVYDSLFDVNEDGVLSAFEIAAMTGKIGLSIQVMESLYIPSSITNIGYSTFDYCNNLNKIKISDLAAWCKIAFSNTGTPLATADDLYLNGKLVEHVVIPEGITELKFATFSGSSITGVTIPASVTAIHNFVFYGCRELKDVYIPNSVKTIDHMAFAGCSAITSFVYDGSSAEWDSVQKVDGWNENTNFVVTFTKADDGHTHDQTKVEGKAPTCTEPGLSEGTKCSVCGLVFVEQKVIPATGHTAGEWTIDKPATNTANGSKSSQCTVCGATLTEIVPCTGSEGLAFVLNADEKSYSVSGIGTCTDTEIIIPSVYNDLPVTAIAKEAFSDNTTITSVFIPGSITNIYMHAFLNCKKIEAVYTDDLGAWCSRSFANYAANPMYYGAKLYVNGELVTDLVVPEGVEKIGTFAFDGGKQITSVSFPEGLKIIDRFAFRGCRNIKSVVLPESLTTINNVAFQNCSITEIFIPANVTHIVNNAFSNTSLVSITVDKNNKVYHSTGTCLIKTEDKSLVICLDGIIPSDGSVTTLSSLLFSNSDITEIIIPNTITNIEQNAFSGCDMLSVFIYDGTAAQWEAVVKGQDWNYDCKFTVQFMVAADGHRHDLVKVEAVAPTCNEAGLTEGSKCSVCEEVFKLQEKVKALGHNPGEWKVVTEPTNTVAGSKSTLCTVCNAEIVESIPALGSEGLAYELNADGTAYTLIGIGTCADTDIVIATTINNIPVTAIGANAFTKNAKITSVVMPNSILSVGENAFYSCSNLKTVKLSTALKTIDNSIFRYCSAITSIVIPTSVTSIGNYAFAGTSLVSVKLPSAVTKIGGSCFNGCKSLETVYFGSKLTNIGSDAFAGCVSLKNITLPASLTTINSYAFSNCTSLTSINIPKKVSTIGAGAFSDCDSLVSITVDPDNANFAVIDNCLVNTKTKALVAAVNGFVIPADESVTSIMAGAFRGLDMVEVVIPDTIKTLGKTMFFNCTSLTNVYFGSGITNIGVNLFSNCPALVSLKVSPENATYYSVDNCVIERSTQTLVVGCSTSVIPTDGRVTSIGDYAFYSASNLTSLNIPKCVTSIGVRAFYDCKGLTEIVVPVGVTKINDYTFGNCYGLVSVVIPETVTSIGEYAFRNCSKLATICFEGTEEQWNAVTKGKNWNMNCKAEIAYGPAHKHTVVHRKAIAATCVSEGNLEYWYCSECGGCWKDSELLYMTNMKDVTLPATGIHTNVTKAAKEATCGDGNIEYVYCKECDYVALPDGTQTTLDATVIKGTGEHTVAKVEAVVPTCEAKGNKEYWTCKTCAMCWSDEAQTNVVTTSSVTLYACSATIKKVAQTAATCTEVGYRLHYKCSLCGKLFTTANAKQSAPLTKFKIAAKGHQSLYVPAVAATETTTGNIEHWVCTRANCGGVWLDAELTIPSTLKDVTIPAIVVAHNLVYTAAIPACHKNGSLEYWYCAHCDCYFTDAEGKFNIARLSLVTVGDLSMLEHHEKVEATATENGMQEYWYCAGCDCYFTDAEGNSNIARLSLVIPATGS